MSEITSDVNWLAVLVGTVISFVLGWLWYSPKMFGEKWAEGVGVSLADSNEMPIAPLFIQLAANFCLAWVVGVTLAANALPFMILIAISFLLIMIAGGKFSQKSNYAICTEAGFVACMVAIMILCHAVL